MKNGTLISCFYPNSMGRIVLESLEEVIGESSMHALLDLSGHRHLIENYPPYDSELAFPFSTLSHLLESLEQMYGPHSGRGLALRAGRAAFKYGVRHYGAPLGMLENSFRLLPLKMKLLQGGKALADLFNHATDQRVRLEEHGEKLLWIIERCPICWQRQAEEPVCHLTVGLFQEALYWLSNGKIFHVEETACIAQGHPACVIEIHLTPIA